MRSAPALVEPDRSGKPRRGGGAACSRRRSSEQYSLFRAYIDARHADGGMADMTVLDYALMVEDSVVETCVTEYRLKPRPAETGDNAADRRVAVRPALATASPWSTASTIRTSRARSLGTYMILEQIEYARSARAALLYLGYWIEGSRKMRYKNRFQPQEHLTSKGWVRTVETPDGGCHKSGK